MPIEKGRIANLSVGFVENDPEEKLAVLISSPQSGHITASSAAKPAAMAGTAAVLRAALRALTAARRQQSAQDSCRPPGRCAAATRFRPRPFRAALWRRRAPVRPELLLKVVEDTAPTQVWQASDHHTRPQDGESDLLSAKEQSSQPYRKLLVARSTC